MAQPSEKLAESLEALRKLQEGGVIAIRSSELTRTDRERLVHSGFVREVMKGWYIPSRPDEPAGESTAWYASFWHFCAAYLKDRFGSDWSLSPEQSLLLLAGNTNVPRQLLVRSPKARNQITNFPHDTSMLEVRAALPEKNELAEQDGLRLFSVPSALVLSPPGFYTQYPTDARAALAMIRDASEVLERLLDGGQSVVAGRLAGAFRNIGRARIADDILEAMRAAGYTVRENDPFEAQSPLTINVRELSPYVNRIRLMWQAMREPVIEVFPAAPGLPRDIDTYLKQVSDTYVLDAYHSLSIEGYRVSTELIERVRSGRWNPDANEDDRNQRNALAARGYWQAHQSVQQSVRRILESARPGAVADEDHRNWYRELFGPSVTAGLVRPGDLAGYRNGPVYIRRSMHVPPSVDAVRDLMPAFFELLTAEENAAVRVVLGHFVFVYIHPYMDGNGRMGRFLMNTMLASGGYPWTIVPVTLRNDYMASLEEASVRQNITPFAQFLARLTTDSLKGKTPPIPAE
jgi:fido (protein-threonine AMPylation protein)